MYSHSKTLTALLISQQKGMTYFINNINLNIFNHGKNSTFFPSLPVISITLTQVPKKTIKF